MFAFYSAANQLGNYFCRLARCYFLQPFYIDVTMRAASVIRMDQRLALRSSNDIDLKTHYQILDNI